MLSKLSKTRRFSLDNNLTNRSETFSFESADRPRINLKEKVSQMNKAIFKTKVNQDKIEKLERETIRGAGAEIPEAKPILKPKKKTDMLNLILKSEHKASRQGTQILKLPKLPFGKHNSYNEESMFKDKHFFEEKTESEEKPERTNELDEITRKFRLHEKKFKGSKRNRLSSAPPTFSDFALFDVYEMGPGRLICNKDPKVIESYDKDKEKYKTMAYRATYKEIESEVSEHVEKYCKKPMTTAKEQKKLINRLLPNKETKDTALSSFYSTKFSSLFEPFHVEEKKINFRRSSLN